MNPNGGQAGEDDRQWRRDQVAALRLRGKTTRQIAEEVGVSHVTVAADLKIIRAQWVEETTASYDEHVASEIKRYDMVLDALWPKLQEANPAAIANFIALSRRRAKLLGLDFSDQTDAARVVIQAQQAQQVTAILVAAMSHAGLEVEQREALITAVRGELKTAVVQGEVE